jgi:glycosyltransferase involved in cell wall biosynthesis
MESPPAKRALYLRLEKWLAPRADLIVSISEHERLAALAEGLPDAGHIAIPHGATPPNPGPRPDGMQCEGLHFVFVGRFDRQKGVDLLMRAMPLVDRQDFTLHLIGAPELSDGAAVDLSDPRVHAHGWVAHNELDSWFAAADAVIIPSRWEGFGLVAIEAMRNGAPVIASDRGALPEVLDMGRAGLIFDPENTTALARLLDELTPDRLKAMGAAGKARYETAYTFQRAALALESGYGLAQARRMARS